MNLKFRQVTQTDLPEIARILAGNVRFGYIEFVIAD